MTAEALACGAVVVGTPAGATPEILRPLGDDLVSADASALALTETLLALLRQPERLTEVRGRARRRIAPGMGWNTVVDSHIETYESVRNGSVLPGRFPSQGHRTRRPTAVSR